MLSINDIQNQNPAELLTGVGEWLEGTGHLSQARMYYEAAFKVDKTFSLALFRLGKLAYKMGQYAEAAKALRQAVRLTPDHAPTYYHLALACEKAGKTRSAIHWAKQVLRYNSEHDDGAFLVLLRCYAALRWWRSVLRVCTVLPQRMHDIGEVKLWQALSYVRLGQISKAAEVWMSVPGRIRKRYREESLQIEQLLSSIQTPLKDKERQSS